MKILNLRRLRTILLICCAIAFVPFYAALAAGIVPCGGPDQQPCNVCFLFVLAKLTIDFILLQAATALAAVALAISGFMFLISGSNPGYYDTAKNIATGVFKGYLVMMAGWLFINTFFMVVGVTDWNGFNMKDGWWKVKVACGWTEEQALDCGDGKVTGEEKCDPKETISDCQARTGHTVETCKIILEDCIEKTCQLKERLECGDGIVQRKNNEECDPGETMAKCLKRTEKTKDFCQDVFDRCDPDNCRLKAIVNQCSKDKDKIGMGCYLDTNGNGKVDESECKKGKYICDPDKKEVKCVNVFGDPEYTKAIYQTEVYKPKDDYTGKSNFYITDYCCEEMMAEYADGKIGDKPFTIVRAKPEDLHTVDPSDKSPLPRWTGQADFAMKFFKCDEVCKKIGKICVGVGLTDPSKNACVYEIHDEMGVTSDAAKCNNAGKNAVSMQLSANVAVNNCKAWYAFGYYSHGGKRWSTGYDKYEYFCMKHDPYCASYGMYKGVFGDFAEVPDDSCGVCKPKAALGEKCTGFNYKQDPSDTCAFHGNDLGETGCYCY